MATVGRVRHPMRALQGVLCLISLAAACSGSSPIPDGSATGDLLLDADCPGEEVPTDLSVTCHRLELVDASLSEIGRAHV